MPTDPMPPAPPARTLPATVLLWAGVAATVVGLGVERTWQHLPAPRFALHLVLAALVAGIAWGLSRWRGWPAALVAAALFAVVGVAYAGPLAVPAGALLAAAALGLGTWLVPESTPARAAVALLVGFGVIAALVGWLLPFPVHERWVHLAWLLGVCAWRREALRAAVAPAATALRAAVDAAPRAALFAVLVLGLASTGLWLPTLQFDDQAYHLALPWQLQREGVYRLDAQTSVWALAPWAGDVLHGLAQVLAGGEARAALNAAWLVLCARLLWALGDGLGLAPALRWLCVALFASQPLVAQFMGGMQTEAPGTAVLLAIALVVQRAPAAPDGATLRTCALLAGFALALKVSHLLLVAPCAVWLLARWRGRVPWKALPLAVLGALVLAGSSYAYAAWSTGNPVLPLFNGVFQSPFFAPVDFDDPRWHAGFDWRLPWRLAFATDRVFEGWPGAAGFAFLALGGATLLALAQRPLRALALVGLACALLPLSQLQYLRYAVPAFTLLIPVAVAAARQGAAPRVLAGLLVALAVLGVAFQANASWILRNGALKDLLVNGREAVIAGFAPERVLAAHQRDAADARARVTLFADPQRPFAAELAGRGLTVAWYDPMMSAAARDAEADESGARWRALFAAAGVTHVVWTPAAASPALRAAMAGATREREAGGFELARLPPATLPARTPSLLEQRDHSPLVWPR
jgi:hypothetical protein